MPLLELDLLPSNSCLTPGVGPPPPHSIIRTTGIIIAIAREVPGYSSHKNKTRMQQHCQHPATARGCVDSPWSQIGYRCPPRSVKRATTSDPRAKCVFHGLPISSLFLEATFKGVGVSLYLAPLTLALAVSKAALPQ